MTAVLKSGWLSMGPKTMEFEDNFAGTSLMRVKRRGLIRNALLCAAGQQARELIPLMRKLLTDDDTLIAETASWCLNQFK